MKHNAQRPDAQEFDEIRIKTIPRFKDSYMSGSEWRISALVSVYQKGRLCFQRSFRDIDAAIPRLQSVLDEASENRPDNVNFAGDGEHCDQEGCSEKTTIVKRFKKTYCTGGGNCGQETDNYENITLRHFCKSHSVRGTSDLEDCDSNYEDYNGSQ